MTVSAVDAERAADEIHHGEKLRIGKPLEHLYVLARLFGRFISLLLSVPAVKESQEACEHEE
jgi:hypothetical protein